jgi:putative endonuclease
MAEHNDTGLKGEQLAADFLQKKGYTILETTWRQISLQPYLKHW